MENMAYDWRNKYTENGRLHEPGKSYIVHQGMEKEIATRKGKAWKNYFVTEKDFQGGYEYTAKN